MTRWSIRIKTRSRIIASDPCGRSGPTWHLIPENIQSGFAWHFRWWKNGLPEAALFAKIEVVGVQRAELDHFDLTGGPGDIIMEYQRAILHVEGVPEIVLDLGVAQEFE